MIFSHLAYQNLFHYFRITRRTFFWNSWIEYLNFYYEYLPRMSSVNSVTQKLHFFDPLPVVQQTATLKETPPKIYVKD